MRWLRGGAVTLGHLDGIEVRVHWTFLVLFAMGGFNDVTLWWFFLLFGTVLLHELGHCYAARMVGGHAREIMLWPLGGLAFISPGRNPRDYAWIAMAGPLAHIPLALACAAVLAAVGHPPAWEDLNPFSPFMPPKTAFWHNLVYLMFKIQVWLFCFNTFVPAYPLDGGQVLIGFLASRLSLEQTVAVAGGVSVLTGLAMLGLEQPLIGLWILYEGLNLLTMLGTRKLDWHPVAGIFGPGRITPAASMVTAATDLKACPNCERPIHARSEMCVHCDTRFPSAPADSETQQNR